MSSKTHARPMRFSRLMPLARPALAVAAAALLGACTATGGRLAPVDATRYHLGTPITQGTVTVEPLSSGAHVSLEFETFGRAVADELARQGFTPVAEGESDYIASVMFRRESLGTAQKRPPVSVGIGGGTYGSGVGVSTGVSFGIGGGRREVIGTELSVQLRRRSDQTVVWEGRARTQSVEGTDAAQPGAEAQRLAAALFKGFPGESGITITVK